MSGIRASLLIVAGVAVALAVIHRVKNPERSTLDEAARRAAPGQFVRLADGMTHYDLAGPEGGQRVALVHGFSVPSYIWDSTVTALSREGFRVARYDLFGRGHSDRPDSAYTLDLFDRQLLQLLDSLGWRERVDIVGLSMGGAVSATFTGRHPERVRSLALIDPMAQRPDPIPALFHIRGLGPMLWQTLVVPGMADGQLTDFVEPARWPDWPTRYRTQMQYRGFGRALFSTLVSLRDESLDTVYTRAGSTGVPVLLIWGTEDQTVPIEQSEIIRRAIPAVQYHPIDSAGHLPHMERSNVVNPLLIDFLRARVTSDSSATAAPPR
jgi:pimeloyl-ACP methyl ester carboxylesterase